MTFTPQLGRRDADLPGHLNALPQTQTLEEREVSRLAALAQYNILDSEPEQAYDDAVKIAAHICGTPMAAVTFIDQTRQWLKARIGLGASETPVEQSFCRYTIQQDDVMVVRDARVDPRFADNPFVRDNPYIRFYAGAPLVTPDGYALGSLCVIDSTPRDLTESQLEALNALSHQVISQLELRRKNDELSQLATNHANALTQIERHVDLLQQEIEQRERAEVLQHESELRFRSIFRAAKTGIFVADSDLKIVLWNTAAEDMFGYTTRDVVNRDFTDLLVEGDRKTVRHNRRKDDDSGNLQVTAVRKDGTTFPLEVALSTWRVDSETYSSGILTDITKRKAIERMKDEFVSNVSHELRTPLTSIKGSLCLIDAGIAGAIPPDVQKLNGIALKSTERLIRLINDLLDSEKLASGKTDFHFDRVRLGPIIEDAIQEVKSFANQFEVTLEYTKSEQAEIVKADRDRIVQVLNNLLSNAVKASKAGGKVLLRTETVQNKVRIAIQDFGSGIPVQFRAHIFDRFTQADSSDTRQKGGTGLGMNIVWALVQAHGGNVTFETAEGVGTTFTVELPLDPEPAVSSS